MYTKRLKNVLSKEEYKLFSKLNTPHKIQDFLDSLPINFETKGDTLYSPRQVLAYNKAHCMEGALFAAAVLAFHGQTPQLLDLQTVAYDQDHVVTLFKVGGKWGAISKTNHAILRWRDPVYNSARELAMSYFHEYHLNNGTKTLVAFSKPFSLVRYDPAWWVGADKGLEKIAIELDESPHTPILPSPKDRRNLRKTSKVERKILEFVEWKNERTRLY